MTIYRASGRASLRAATSKALTNHIGVYYPADVRRPAPAGQFRGSGKTTLCRTSGLTPGRDVRGAASATPVLAEIHYSLSISA
jgi:hypothetical protein